MTKEPILRSSDVAYLERNRIGHLATANAHGQPHVVPVCFVCHDGAIYISIDAKPKRVEAHRLKRVRNVVENPLVSFVVDEYAENWEKLSYLLIQGIADVREPADPEHAEVVARLRAKYPQYQTMPIETQPSIRIQPTAVTRWAGRGGAT